MLSATISVTAGAGEHIVRASLARSIFDAMDTSPGRADPHGTLQLVLENKFCSEQYLLSVSLTHNLTCQTPAVPEERSRMLVSSC